MAWFLNILRWLLRIVVVVLMALALSIPLDWFINRNSVSALTNTFIVGERDIHAFVATPNTTESVPAIIMVHEFWGLKSSIIGKARALAEEGYVVVAPDTFRGRRANWLPTAIMQVIMHTTAQVNRDLDSIYAWLEEQPNVDSNRIMIMGFCYGGRASLHYSLHNDNVAATAIFYGSLVTDANRLTKLPGPVLGVFGETDSSIPLSQVKAFEGALAQAGIEHQISIYPDQGHAFVESIEAIRQGGVQAEAWQEFLDFTAKHLKETG